MTAPLSEFVAVALVADADTPTDLQPRAGQVLLLPPEYLTALGSGPTDPGVLAGVRGYHRTAADGSHEWLMTGPLPAALRRAVNAIPGPQGWSVTASGQTFRGVARALYLDRGIPAPEVLDALTRLHQAAVVDRDAQLAAPS